MILVIVPIFLLHHRIWDICMTEPDRVKLALTIRTETSVYIANLGNILDMFVGLSEESID